ncbi:MAG: citrate transporter [bacterium]
MMPSLLIFLIFLIAATLMFLRKLPALLALPLMAIAIAGVELMMGRLSVRDLTMGVLADGAIRLADPMIISFFGGMLSVIMQKSGVAESFIRRGAEFSGDNPWSVAVFMLALITLLFTTIGGLGAVIMVGTIALPILSSMGVREHISAGIMLFGITIGGVLNAGNWIVYQSVLHLETNVVSSYAIWIFFIVGLGALGFITVELFRTGLLRLSKRWWLRSGLVLMISGSVLFLSYRLFLTCDVNFKNFFTTILDGLLLLLLLSIILDLFRKAERQLKHCVRWYAYLIPVIPLLLIMRFDMPFVPAFMIGVVYAMVAVRRKGLLNLTTRSVIEGSAGVIPAVVLMIGIGMLLSSILGPTKTGPGKYWYETETVAQTSVTQDVQSPQQEWPVLAEMKPLLENMIPHSFGTYVLIFALLGPLALYRGPLNVWGLGYGVGGVLLATGVPAGAVMGILMSLGMIQGVSDPTNTANVWVANELHLDVNTIMWRTLPYTWIVATVGLIIAGVKFFG